jgi:hypothetical protein
MKTTTLLLIFLVAAHISWAQETETNTDLGIEFTYPSNWKPTAQADGYLIGSEKLEGFILVRVGSFKSLKKMKASMKNGITQEDGSVLTLLNELQPYGENALAGMYEGMVDEQKVRGFLIGKFNSNNNKSAITIVVAPATRFNQSHMDALKMIGRSLKFL